MKALHICKQLSALPLALMLTPFAYTVGEGGEDYPNIGEESEPAWRTSAPPINPAFLTTPEQLKSIWEFGYNDGGRYSNTDNATRFASEPLRGSDSSRPVGVVTMQHPKLMSYMEGFSAKKSGLTGTALDDSRNKASSQDLSDPNVLAFEGVLGFYAKNVRVQLIVGGRTYDATNQRVESKREYSSLSPKYASSILNEGASLPLVNTLYSAPTSYVFVRHGGGKGGGHFGGPRGGGGGFSPRMAPHSGGKGWRSPMGYPHDRWGGWGRYHRDGWRRWHGDDYWRYWHHYHPWWYTAPYSSWWLWFGVPYGDGYQAPYGEYKEGPPSSEAAPREQVSFSALFDLYDSSDRPIVTEQDREIRVVVFADGNRYEAVFNLDKWRYAFERRS